MPRILFEIEQTAHIAFQLPVVLARILEPQRFALGDFATLGGSGVVQMLEIPSALRADGSPRVGLFAFALADDSELERFARGDVVELVP
ncbi:MAG: hypothetical protein WKG32_15040 [Gemmatimonadaceae bacterium]